MGYAKNLKTYRLLNLDSNIVVESRNVEFLETNFISDPNPNPQARIKFYNNTKY